MKNNCYVYECIRLDDNTPFYVGKGSGRRWKSSASRNTYFKNIANKYGYAVIILKDNLTSEESLEYESWYIYNYRDIEGYWLVNQTDGGEGLSGHKQSDEHKRKLSESHQGQIPWNKGKTNVYSEETLRKKSESQKGRTKSPEQKQKVSEGLRKFHKSKEKK